VSLLWLISPIEGGFNRRSPDRGCLVYSPGRHDEKGRADVYPYVGGPPLRRHDKTSITYSEKVDIMREHTKPSMI